MKRAGTEDLLIPGVSILLWTLLLPFGSFPAAAAPIHVPADYSTIQAAINAATSGDEITVSTGTYTENINFLGKNIILRSTDPVSTSVVATTIIDGNQAGSVVTFSGTELSSCLLAGFTLTGGYHDMEAGGIQGNGTHATIQNNRIVGNGNGGGGLSSQFGGGLFRCDGAIRHNAILNNHADAGHGGGLLMCNGIIEGNVISSNTAMFGGALCLCDGTIQNNVIAGNWAGDCGGLLDCHGTIQNNTIFGNQTTRPESPCAGGLVISYGPITGTIRNCIIWGNTAPVNTQITNCPEPSYCCIENWSGGGTGNIALNPQMTNPTSGDFHLLAGSPCIDAGGAVGLSQDFEGNPRPFDWPGMSGGDGSNYDMGAYELVAPFIIASHAIGNSCLVGNDAPTQTLQVWNAGNGTLAYIVETTLSWLVALPAVGYSDGPASRTTHRIVYHTASLGLGDYSGAIRVSDPGAINSPVSIPVTLTVRRPGNPITVGKGGGYDYGIIQKAIDAATTGNTIVVYPATYFENINFKGKTITLRSTDPTSPAVVACTVIDAHGTGTVVTFAGSERTTCVIEGFTITGGRAAKEAAGIHGNGAHATIQNNVISSNTASGYYTLGGGIWLCNGLIQNNTISSNSAGYGGGLGNCYGVIQNNRIFGNSAKFGGGLGWCNGTIRNNTIFGNSATSSGGGLHMCEGWIQNNTIFGNSGGGLYKCDATIRNCIIWGNSGLPAVFEGSTPLYCCIENWSGGGTGNITANPQLADPTHGDFHLLPTSPCIDAGGTVTLTQDFEGDPRPSDWPGVSGGDGSNFDIGADEIAPPPTIAFSPTSLITCAREGTNAATQTLQVWNGGRGTLAYTIQTTWSWLTVTPATGNSNGPANRKTHRVGFRTASLAPGDHFGAVTVTAPAASNNPVRIPVRVKIGLLVVVSPAGGETWVAGTSHEIVWESHGAFTQVYLDVVRPGLTRRLATASNQPGINRLLVRLPSDLTPATDYVIRVSSVSDPTTILDDSSRFTVVTPPTFAVIWPTTGTVWQAGVERNFTFACARPPTMGQLCVDLWRNHAFVRFLTAVPCQAGTNAVPLRLPADVAAGANYQLRLYWTVDASVCSLSGNFTVIAPPTFAITWPDAATIWRTGATGAVTWTCANLPTPSRMYMDIWRNGKYARYWTQVSVHQGTNSVSLQLPSDLSPGPDYQIRLSWIEDATNCAWSARFSIERAAQPLSVTRFRFYD